MIQLRQLYRAGSVLYVAARLLSYALGGLAGVIVARTLGPSKYGPYATGTSVVGTILLFSALGLDQLYLRKEIGKRQLRRYLLSISLAMLVCTYVAAALWPLSPQARLIVVIAGTGSVLGLLTLPWLLTPQRDLLFAVRAKRQIFIGLVSSVAIAGTAVVTRSAPDVALASLGSSAALVAWSRARDRIAQSAPRRRLPARHFRTSQLDDFSSNISLQRAVRSGLPYSVSGALYLLYFSVDVALVGTIAGNKQAGYYQVASGFMTVASVLPVALNNEVLRPKLYRYYEVLRESRQQSSPAKWFLLLSVSFGGGVSCVIFLGGHVLVHVLFGTAYATRSGQLVVILAPAILPHYFNSWAGNMLVAWRRMKGVIMIQSVMMVGNIVGNVLLIGRYGATAAAWMTVGTEVGGALLYGAYLISGANYNEPLVKEGVVEKAVH